MTTARVRVRVRVRVRLPGSAVSPSAAAAAAALPRDECAASNASQRTTRPGATAADTRVGLLCRSRAAAPGRRGSCSAALANAPPPRTAQASVPRAAQPTAALARASVGERFGQPRSPTTGLPPSRRLRQMAYLCTCVWHVQMCMCICMCMCMWHVHVHVAACTRRV